MLAQLPAQYAKAIASAVTMLVTYLTAYGPVWHLVPAIIAMSSILGVGAVPNASKVAPVPPQPAQQPPPSSPPPFPQLPPRT